MAEFEQQQRQSRAVLFGGTDKNDASAMSKGGGDEDDESESDSESSSATAPRRPRRTMMKLGRAR